MEKQKQKQKEEPVKWDRTEAFRSSAMRYWTVIIWLAIGTMMLIGLQIYHYVHKYQEWREENSRCFSAGKPTKCLNWKK